MSKLTSESSDVEIEKMNRRWRYVRKRLGVEASEPGESATLYEEMITAPEMRNFFVFRAAYKARHPEIKRRINARYYERVLKVQRSTPEARVRLAAARRQQRRFRKSLDHALR